MILKFAGGGADEVGMAPIRVLVVDDEPMLLSALKRLLRGDIELHTVGSGAQALVELANASFAVVVSDLRMPEMDGRRFLALAHDLAPTVKQIILTGTTDAAKDLTSEERNRIERILVKPCSRHELVSAIEAAAGMTA